MDPLLWLFLLSLSMLIGSFVAGSIPLAFKLSDERLRMVTCLGVGLLVGTALIVIIPEGIETLYEVPDILPETALVESPTGTEYDVVKRSLLAVSNMALDSVGSSLVRHGIDDEELQPADAIQRIKDEMAAHPEELDRLVYAYQDMDAEESSAHRYVGAALILGFALMFLIDQFSSLHLHSHASPHQVSVSDFTELRTMLEAVDDDNDNDDLHHDLNGNANADNVESNSPNRRHYHPTKANPSASISPTVGLIVHAAADGIALGASASQPHLSFIVFLAIMLHKAPSAFGLTTVLLNAGIHRRQIRKHLALFSFAAPLGAIITYIALQQSGSIDPVNMQWWTGLVLLFSGGTFLYVAMHVLEEVKAGQRNGDQHRQMTYAEIGCICIGMFLPLVLAIEHGH